MVVTIRERAMRFSTAAIAAHDPAQTAALSQACQALWLATLSLMTAFMQTPAPAHRLLLARRIARNFRTLRDEPCFAQETRARFARLVDRWELKVQRLEAGEEERATGAFAWLKKRLLLHW
jgi:hypothetical protein